MGELVVARVMTVTVHGTLGRTIWPRANTNAVPRAVGQRPGRWFVPLGDDAAARSDGCLEPRLDVLSRYRHIDMHRVLQ